MTENNEKKVEPRAVVIDESGNPTTVKSEEEVASENAQLEKELQPEEKSSESSESAEKPELDMAVLEKLKQKQEGANGIKAVDKRDRSLYFGVVGLGQAGSRVTETFFKKGYSSCVFNTASQDLEHIDIPAARKTLLPLALGGAGKELENGRQAIEENAEAVLEQLEATFTDKNEMLILAVSGGGGTGSGGAEAMIGLMSSLGRPILVIFILPSEMEDGLAKHNTLTTLDKLAKMASSDVIGSLIIVDNSRIELIYPGLSKAEFFEVANNAIVEPIHLFNQLSSKPSKYTSLDPMDFSRLLVDSGDCMIYGMTEIEDYADTTSIAEALIENLSTNLLAADFDLKETRFGGYIVAGNSKVMRELPAINISYAGHVISEACDNPQIVSGIYELPIEEDVVRVYTIFTGLGLPEKRLNALKEDATSQMANIREKERNRTTQMSVDYTVNDTKSKTENINRMIKQKKGAFGTITRNANTRIKKDRRRR